MGNYKIEDRRSNNVRPKSKRMINSELASWIFFWTLVLSFIPVSVEALTYRHNHHLFSLDPSEYRSWKSTEEIWVLSGQEVLPPTILRSEGDEPLSLPENFQRITVSRWDHDAIARTIELRIALAIDRSPGSVTIDRDDNGFITFDGIGMLGRAVDIDATVDLTIHALEHGGEDIVLPVTEIQPEITVLDRELKELGIQEVVSVGESNFAGSPEARIHNIATGLQKISGVLIPKGEVFSFNAALGPVGPQTGFREELVIVGDRTIPEYGGGLCQISTTAYRGAWEYGFPIESRRNHSFAVGYYSPQGTDATIYPPWTDMQFANNSPGALLTQTHIAGDRAYVIYYGTRDARIAEVMGPYVWDRRDPPEHRVEETTEIPAGETRILGRAVSGMKSAWFRSVQMNADEEEVIDRTFSQYEARPLFTQIGVATSPLHASSDSCDPLQASCEDPTDEPRHFYRRGIRYRAPIYGPRR